MSHSRPASGSSLLGARDSALAGELRRRRGRARSATASKLCFSAALARRRQPSRRSPDRRRGARPPRRHDRSRRRRRPPRRRRPRAASRSSPPGAETKIAAGPSASRSLRRRSRRADVDSRPARSRDRRAKAERLRVQERASQPGESSSSRSSARVVARPAGSSSTAIRSRLSAGRRDRGRRRAGRSRTRRRIARPRHRPSPRRSREARRPVFGGGRAVSAGPGYASRSREKNVAAVSACVEVSARYERLGSPGSNPWTTSKRPCASASRGSRARRPARPCSSGGRPGSTGRRR